MRRSRPTRGFYIEKYEVRELKNNEELFWKLEEADKEDRPFIMEEIFINNIRTIRNVIDRRFGKAGLSNLLSKYRITYDELFCVGSDALMKSIQVFDIHRGFKFTTLSYKAMHNAYSKFFDRIKVCPDDVSLEATVIENSGEDKSVSLSDVLTKDEDISEDITKSLFLSQVLDGLKEEIKPRDMAIMESFLDGLTQMQIAKEHGISQTQVSRIIKKTQEKAREIREVMI